MEQIVRFEHIHQYNTMVEQENFHPLVSIVDFSKAKALGSKLDFSDTYPDQTIRVSFGFYAIFLKDGNCGDIRYAKKHYDYQEGTLVFISPGQVFGVKKIPERLLPVAWHLSFTPIYCMEHP